jgi:cation transport regulator
MNGDGCSEIPLWKPECLSNAAHRCNPGARRACRCIAGDDTKEAVMPYSTNADLPSSVSDHLPSHAQDIYREAFNHAFEAHEGDSRQEEASHRIAWAAIKRSYVKQGDSWVRRA